jgi:hypothetical protein
MAKKADLRLQTGMIKKTSEVFGVVPPDYLNAYVGLTGWLFSAIVMWRTMR